MQSWRSVLIAWLISRLEYPLRSILPQGIKTFSDALYFVTFIDDCSRKLWVYVLKTKDQVLEKFKQFQALIERQSGMKGIKHEKTLSKTPQLNGLVERMNETLIEKLGACFLKESYLGISGVRHFT
ncbi:hypothetical protein CR513_12384, partial [Mucuna pruriens]